MKTAQQLIDENIDLVKYRSMAAARRFGDECGEYMTSGYIGLVDAAERFEPRRGIRFRTFAQRRVDGAILDQVRNQHGRKGSRRHRTLSRTRSICAADDLVCVRPIAEIEDRDEIDVLARRLCPQNDQVGVVVRAFAEGKTYKQAGLMIGTSESRVSKLVDTVIRPLMRDRLRRRRVARR